MKLSTIRRITLLLVVVAVIVGLIWHSGTGTLSSFGWRQIAAICPLGAVETFLASKTILPIPLLILLVLIVLGTLLGKVFCSWLCPVPPLRRIFFKKKKVTSTRSEALKAQADKNAADKDASPAPETAPAVAAGEAVAAATAIQPLSAKEQQLLAAHGNHATAEHNTAHGCQNGCTSCATQRKKLDSRHVILGGALLSTVIFGFPVFCLVCPVGLVFATIIAFWHWIGFNQLSLTLIVFPAILALEVLVLRKWCVKFCPLGAVFSLMSLPNRFFRPRVDTSKCLRLKGIECNLCVEFCDEGLDPHFSQGMHECAKCGHCMEHCPANAISMPFKPAKRVKAPQETLQP